MELLYIAEQLKIPIKEVAITWHEVDGLLNLHSCTIHLLNLYTCTTLKVLRSFRCSVGFKWAETSYSSD